MKRIAPMIAGTALAAWACSPAPAPLPAASAVPAAAEPAASASPAQAGTRVPPFDEAPGQGKGAASVRKRQVESYHETYKNGADFKADKWFEDAGRKLKVERVALKAGVRGPDGAIVLTGGGAVSVDGQAAHEVAIANTVNAPMSDLPNTLVLTDATTGGKLELTADVEFLRFTGKSAKGGFKLDVNPDGSLTLDGQNPGGLDGAAKRLAEGVAAGASPEQLVMLEAVLVGDDQFAKRLGMPTLNTVDCGNSTGARPYAVLATGGFDVKALVRAVLAKRQGK